MRVDEWSSIVATEVLNMVERKYKLGDERAAAIADAIVVAVYKHWSTAPQTTMEPR